MAFYVNSAVSQPLYQRQTTELCVTRDIDHAAFVAGSTVHATNTSRWWPTAAENALLIRTTTASNADYTIHSTRLSSQHHRSVNIMCRNNTKSRSNHDHRLTLYNSQLSYSLKFVWQSNLNYSATRERSVYCLSLIHIWRCRRRG